MQHLLVCCLLHFPLVNKLIHFTIPHIAHLQLELLTRVGVTRIPPIPHHAPIVDWFPLDVFAIVTYRIGSRISKDLYRSQGIPCN